MDENRHSSPVYKALKELEKRAEKQTGEEELKHIEEKRRKISKIAAIFLRYSDSYSQPRGCTF